MKAPVIYRRFVSFHPDVAFFCSPERKRFYQDVSISQSEGICNFVISNPVKYSIVVAGFPAPSL